MGASQSNYIANAYHVEIQAKVSVDEDLYTRVMKEGKGKFKVGAVGNTFGKLFPRTQ